ncbi:MAG TPA: type I polyketide synthase, partial [Solirubrobacterales bacterium]|nr:type I polyketide synthase [Solirubrobacterales bacterium]
ANGFELDWDAYFKGAKPKRVALPTYPFQRKRYWLASTQGSADASSIGLTAAGHPLLGAAVDLAGGDGLLLTGRVSLATHPWLADHVLAETVLMPGAAFLELALRAAEEVGAETIGELSLEKPLVLPEQGYVDLQVTLGSRGERGEREIAIHARPGGAQDDLSDAGPGWIRHATGVVSEQPAPEAPERLDDWPPPGTQPIETDYLHDLLAEHGAEYGSAFQGLSRAWRDGERIFAEVALPEETAHEAQRFAIHPALLDAALHAQAFVAIEERGRPLSLLSAWKGVSVAAAGARELRVQIAPSGDEGVSLLVADPGGAPVARIAELHSRPLDLAALQTTAPQQEGLLAVEWAPASLPDRDGPPEEVEILVCEVDGAGAEAARGAAKDALEAVQRRLASEVEEGSRLAMVTRGAMAVKDGEAPDPATAALWGLVRSAQSEHPGRFALVDSDGSEASEAALPAALAVGAEEPQVALRDGEAYVPRIRHIRPPDAGEAIPAALDPERTILITGATGGLGSLVARHLVERHGARHLLLASRSGLEANGATELQADLTEMGAEVAIVACDVSNRGALEQLLATVPADHPLGAVVHTAGALADGTVDSLGPEHVDLVFGPKADAAWHLHELTRDLDLSALILFSSASGTLGGPGQANYAAANVFLDVLAQRRRAEGLPATSIAWGLWERASGMVSALGEADIERMRRGGVEPLSDERGLELFDAALGSDRGATLGIPFDLASLRALAAAGALAPILGGLVRTPRRRRAALGSLTAKLASLPEAEHEAHVLELVRTQVAAMLGHGSAEEIAPDRAFQELGFDSLAAVELRNRLDAVAGLRLPATVVFDHPSAAALSAHLLATAREKGNGGASASESMEAEIRDALASIPLSRLRQEGLIDSLLRLAHDEDGEVEVEPDEDGEAIDSMDLEDLIRKSVEGLPGDGAEGEL